MFQISFRKNFSILSLLILSLCFTACSRKIQRSNAEQEAVEQDPFQKDKKGQNNGGDDEVFDPNDSTTGVNGSDDSFIPLNFNTAQSIEAIQNIKRCEDVVDGQSRAELEKQQALAAAASNPTLIPVRYSISTGSVWDDTAYKAFRRTILRDDHDGKTFVSIGPKDAAGSYYYAGGGAKHYVTNHNVARDNYINGEKCFYSVVQIEELVHDQVKYFNPETQTWQVSHPWRLMHYGKNYAQNPEMENLSPRLFDEVENLDEPQIIPLYIADIRDISLNWTEFDDPILQAGFDSSSVRGNEYEVTLKEVFHLDHIFEHRQNLTEILSSDRMVGDKLVNAYEGVPQLIDNLLFGYRATVLSTKYTPLVLDLGEPNIRTSSVDWGSFFNMTNYSVHPDKDPLEPWNVSHMTAWIGGALTQTAEGDNKNWQRIADDAFLVLPTVDGNVLTSEQLFGDQMNINGYRFANGFHALRALTEKNCSAEEVEERYFGPWDGALYDNIVKVWVDADRNGRVGNNELRSLEESRVAAINTCQIVSAQASDAYGNETHLRSSFLMVELDLDIGQEHDEIKRRIETGLSAAGIEAKFRVMIDIFFQTRPLQILQNLEIEDLVDPSGGFIPEYDEGELPPLQGLSFH